MKRPQRGETGARSGRRGRIPPAGARILSQVEVDHLVSRRRGGLDVNVKLAK